MNDYVGLWPALIAVCGFYLSLLSGAVELGAVPEDEKKAEALRALQAEGFNFDQFVSALKAVLWLLLGVSLVGVGPPLSQSFGLAGVIAGYIIIVLLALVIMEALPSIIVRRLANGIAPAIAKSGRVLFIVLKYPVLLAFYASSGITRIFGFKPGENEAVVTENEIKKLLGVPKEETAIEEAEREMIINVFDFDNVAVEEICTHRRDIVSLHADAGIDDINELIRNEKYSRMPVYDENIDDIVGILHIRDYINYLNFEFSEQDGGFELGKLLRKPVFVPISKKTDVLFAEMQSSKNHIAIVVDEYGGTVGLVTMEDIVEEIMGNILDEHDDEEEPEIVLVDEKNFLLSGAADLEDAADMLGAELPCEEYDTVGGFVIAQLGRIPEDGETPEFEYGGVLFRVREISDKLVTSVSAQIQ